jgi:sugar-specific transcriptional regulator TrmB
VRLISVALCTVLRSFSEFSNKNVGKAKNITLFGELREMDVPSEQIEFLARLGLTLAEAKIFFALSRNGTSTAKTVAKSSGVAREVVYRIMPKLYKKGLVVEVVASPKTFKAIAIKDACDLLLQRKEEENELLREEIKALRNNKIATDDQIEQQIILVPPSKKNDLRWEQEWLIVQETVDMIISSKKFSQWAQSTAERRIGGAMKRNVKIRIVTEKQVQKTLTTQKTSNPALLAKLAYIKFKFVAKFPLTELTVFDKKNVHISIQNENRIEKMSWLCTNNPLIVDMANYQFENLWSTST